MSNLLVVDWDFFFHNPMEAGDYESGEQWLYDWGHSESPFFIEGNFIWPERALGFERAGVPLPTVDVPPNFWSRFKFENETKLYVADSNAYAGLVSDQDGDPFEHVYLFDAHHDLYKMTSEAEVARWHMQDNFTCENWMFKHLVRGAKLHWRMPQWHDNAMQMADELPDWIGLDATYDDGKPMDVLFDTIFLCRSGAWVPPWCDDEFEQFMNTAPVVDVEQMDEYDLHRGDYWRKYLDMFRTAMGTAL